MEVTGYLNKKDLEDEKAEDVLKALLGDSSLYEKLYPHQQEGILFLFNAYKNGKNRANGSRNGAILADEMGLGKSIQVILFLHGMIMNTQDFKNALLVVPAGLLSDWKVKLEKWTSNMNMFIYHHTETELPGKLRNVQKSGGILLVSYRTFVYHYKTLTTYKGMPFLWDCLIFDEAHKLKNTATKAYKAAASISTGFHILITGTPMQNNLKEFWSLFSLISDTCLLGTYKTFKNNFENPITKGMEADSGPEERALGMGLLEPLKKKIESHWLRRTIYQIQSLEDQTLLENKLSQALQLPTKNEYVIWIKLSPEQETAYCKVVEDSYNLTLQTFHSLIPVCTHPRLNSDILEHEMSDVHLAESGKLSFIMALLERFCSNGNFALVFSNYIKILDIIQKALKQTTWGRKSFLRLDGNTNERDKIVSRFQKRESKNILLLTTNVGSEGLTLTAADCVVFADPSWNPSHDAQAVGRAHRIGQTKVVETYRLITCGTLEEMIYRRQLFKGSLTKQVMGDDENPLRHFTQDELKGILTLQETQFSSTQQQLAKHGAKYLSITEVFGAGINTLSTTKVCGISDHGQLLSASQGEDIEVSMARMHITDTVKICQQEIEAESHLTRDQTGLDMAFKKCGRKAKFRRRADIKTPVLPRKYKGYTTPFSGTRRKTLHISRPCVFESSESSSFSDVEDVNLSNKSTQHTARHEASDDLFNQSNVFNFICQPTCSEHSNGEAELLQEFTSYDTKDGSILCSGSSPNDCQNMSFSGGDTNLNKSKTVNNNDSNDTDLSSGMGKHISCSYLCDSSVSSRISADEQVSGDNIHFKQSYNDQDDSSLPSNISRQMDTHRSKSDITVMLDVKLGELNVFQEEPNPAGVQLAEAGQQQTLFKQEKVMSPSPEFSEESQNNMSTDLHKNTSIVADLDKNLPLVAVTPQSVNTIRNRSSNYTSHHSTYMEENKCSHLQENNNISTNSSKASNISRSVLRLKSNQIVPVLCDYSLTPSCVSMLDTPSGEKENHVLRENFQSTPLLSVEPHDTQDLLKKRLFSHFHPVNKVHSGTPVMTPKKGKSQFKRTPVLPQNYKHFSPSLTKTKTKNTNSVKKLKGDSTAITTGLNSLLANLLANVNTVSLSNVSVQKALRSIFFPKAQLRKKKYGLSRKCKRSTFSVTYRKHKKNLLKSEGIVQINQLVGQPYGRQLKFDSVVESEMNTSLINSEWTDALITEKSGSLSSSSSKYEYLYSHNIDMEDVNTKQRGYDLPEVKQQYISPLNDISVDESHNSMKFVQLKEFTQTSTLDEPEFSTANNSKMTSCEEDDAEDLFSSHMSHVSESKSKASIWSLSVYKSIISDDEQNCEMSFSPENYFISRKVYQINDHTDSSPFKTSSMKDQSNEFTNMLPLKMKTEQCSDKESELSSTFSMDCHSITESEDNTDDFAEQNSVLPVVKFTAQSPFKQINIANGRDEIQDASQIYHESDGAFGISAKLHIKAMGNGIDLSDCHKAFADEQTDTKSTDELHSSDGQNFINGDIDEIFCLLKNLKTL